MPYMMPAKRDLHIPKVNTGPAEPPGNFERLSFATSERVLDIRTAILATQPFASQERYERYLLSRFRIGCDLAPVYDYPIVSWMMPGLTDGGQITDIRQDLNDLGLAPQADGEVKRGPTAGLSELEALGWLFVAEGARLASPYFLKQAQKLGFDDSRGASHLAHDPDLIRTRWARVASSIDSIAITADAARLMSIAAGAALCHIREIMASPARC